MRSISVVWRPVPASSSSTCTLPTRRMKTVASAGDAARSAAGRASLMTRQSARVSIHFIEGCHILPDFAGIAVLERPTDQLEAAASIGEYRSHSPGVCDMHDVIVVG